MDILPKPQKNWNTVRQGTLLLHGTAYQYVLNGTEITKRNQTLVKMKVVIFWDVVLGSLVDILRGSHWWVREVAIPR
jgi:hypothetical protein